MISSTWLYPLCRRITAVLLCASIGSPAITAMAKDGRDYAGSYQITRAIRSGPDVTVTISLTFVNYGDESLRDARVLLKDQAGLDLDHGAFPALVSTEKRGSDRIVGTFRVPGAEFDRWTSGVAPRFVLARTDNGRKVERPIAVVRTGVQP